jgi:hypothetical protein
MKKSINAKLYERRVIQYGTPRGTAAQYKSFMILECAAFHSCPGQAWRIHAACSALC